ncbi:MAG: restriction system protein [Mycobacterium sp.]|nr:restriction system protein [Mycobacterium sp.]
MSVGSGWLPGVMSSRRARRRPVRARRSKLALAFALLIGLAAGLRSADNRLVTTVSVAAIVLGACAVVAVLRKARPVVAYMTSGLREVDSMTGVDFETYVAARLRAAGYRVSPTKITGDFGVDLIASKGGERLAVQCKRHGQRIGPAAVQQVVAGAAMHRCSTTMVVSNQEFTASATALAQAHSCELVGRSRLPRWARSFR